MVEDAKWIQNCKLCNDGIVIAVKERIANGMSERAACRDLVKISQEAYPELANELSFYAIYSRWRYYAKDQKGGAGNPRTSCARTKASEKDIPETKSGISDLESHYLARLKDAQKEYDNVLMLDSYFDELALEQRGYIHNCPLCSYQLLTSVEDRIAKGMCKEVACRDIAEKYVEDYHKYSESTKEYIKSIILERYEVLKNDKNFKFI